MQNFWARIDFVLKHLQNERVPTSSFDVDVSLVVTYMGGNQNTHVDRSQGGALTSFEERHGVGLDVDVDACKSTLSIHPRPPTLETPVCSCDRSTAAEHDCGNTENRK